MADDPCPPQLPTNVAVTDVAARIAVFWTFYGNELDSADARLACQRICTVLKGEHGCITVGCMQRLTRNQLARVLAAQGKAAWLSSVEHLLDHEFTRDSHRVPDSACLADGQDTPAPTSTALVCKNGGTQIELYKPKERLGAYLKRRGELGLIAIPWDAIATAIEETDAPDIEALSCNDTRAVAAEIFTYLALQWDYVAGDKILHTYIAKALGEKYRPYGSSKWYKIIKNRFHNGRCTSGKVCPLLLSLPLCPLNACTELPVSVCRRGTRLCSSRRSTSRKPTVWRRICSRARWLRTRSHASTRRALRMTTSWRMTRCRTSSVRRRRHGVPTIRFRSLCLCLRKCRSSFPRSSHARSQQR